MNNKIRINKTDYQAILEMRNEYLTSLPKFQDLYLEIVVKDSDYYLLLSEFQTIGYAVVNDSNTLVEFYVCAKYLKESCWQEEGDFTYQTKVNERCNELFKTILSECKIEQILCKSFDMQLMNCCNANRLPHTVQGILYREFSAPLSSPENNSHITASTHLNASTHLTDNSRLADNSHLIKISPITDNSLLKNDSPLTDNSRLTASTHLTDNSRLADNSHLIKISPITDNSPLTASTHLKASTHLTDNSRLADNFVANNFLDSANAVMRYAQIGDLPFLISQDDEVFEPKEHLEVNVNRKEIIICEKNSLIVGCGFLTQIAEDFDYFDLGVWVNPDHRRKGYAVWIMQYMRSLCLNSGWVPICGCSAENHASQKMLSKIGYVCNHKLLEFRNVILD